MAVGNVDEVMESDDFVDQATSGTEPGPEGNLDEMFDEPFPDTSEEVAEAATSEETGEPDFEQLAENLEVKSVEPTPEPAKESGAERRIRQLVERAKAAEQTAGQFQAQLQQQQQAMQQQMYAQQTQLQQQNELLRQKLDGIHQTSEKKRYEEMSVADQIKYDAQNQARALLETEIQKRISPLEQRFVQQERERAAQQELSARQQRLAYYQNEASQALPAVVFSGLDPSDTGTLGQPMEEILLAHAGAFGLTPAQSAPHVKKILDTYAKAYIKSQAKASKARRLTAQKSVTPVAATRNPGVGRTTNKIDPSTRSRDPMAYFDEIADKIFG